MRLKKISGAVVRRLPIYLRVLDELARDGAKELVSSQELGERAGVSPALVRKDLAWFGEFGKQGVGYDVKHLRTELRRILHLDRDVPVALVGVMAAVAIPNFIKFQARARQSEGKAQLRALYTAMHAAHVTNGSYPTSFADSDWRPEDVSRYTYVLGNDVLQATQGGPYEARLETYVRDGQFKAAALSNVDGDSTLDIWTIDETGTLVNVSDDVNE